jgi:hypothetical protein
MISKAVKIAAAAGAVLMACVGQADASQQMTVVRNGMLRVTLPAAAGSVIVANPLIADVNVVDSHTIYVIGRGYGSSAVTILDKAGRPIFDSQVMVTSSGQNAVTMYKGSTPTILVCSNVCQPAGDDNAANPQMAAAAGQQSKMTTAAPAGTGAAPVAPLTTAAGAASEAIAQ